jgi:hypothetical protein
MCGLWRRSAGARRRGQHHASQPAWMPLPALQGAACANSDHMRPRPHPDASHTVTTTPPHPSSTHSVAAGEATHGAHAPQHPCAQALCIPGAGAPGSAAVGCGGLHCCGGCLARGCSVGRVLNKLLGVLTRSVNTATHLLLTFVLAVPAMDRSCGCALRKRVTHTSKSGTRVACGAGVVERALFKGPPRVSASPVGVCCLVSQTACMHVTCRTHPATTSARTRPPDAHISRRRRRPPAAAGP